MGCVLLLFQIGQVLQIGQLIREPLKNDSLDGLEDHLSHLLPQFEPVFLLNLLP